MRERARRKRNSGWGEGDEGDSEIKRVEPTETEWNIEMGWRGAKEKS